MNLTRTKIINGDFAWPEKDIMIKPSRHYIEQLNCRLINRDSIPRKIRVTKDNIHSAKCKDGKRLTSVVVRVEYNEYKHLYICLNPYDGAGKSLWVKRKDEKGFRKDN